MPQFMHGAAGMNTLKKVYSAAEPTTPRPAHRQATLHLVYHRNAAPKLEVSGPNTAGIVIYAWIEGIGPLREGFAPLRDLLRDSDVALYGSFCATNKIRFIVGSVRNGLNVDWRARA